VVVVPVLDGVVVVVPVPVPVPVLGPDGVVVVVPLPVLVPVVVLLAATGVVTGTTVHQ
jgi:hypothetical protein